MRKYKLNLTSKIILIVFSLFIISLGGYLLIKTIQLSNVPFYIERLVVSIASIIYGISLFIFSVFFTSGLKVKKVYFFW